MGEHGRRHLYDLVNGDAGFQRGSWGFSRLQSCHWLTVLVYIQRICCAHNISAALCGLQMGPPAFRPAVAVLTRPRFRCAARRYPVLPRSATLVRGIPSLGPAEHPNPCKAHLKTSLERRFRTSRTLISLISAVKKPQQSTIVQFPRPWSRGSTGLFPMAPVAEADAKCPAAAIPSCGGPTPCLSSGVPRLLQRSSTGGLDFDTRSGF